ncbi:hypothetical protein LCGC14_1223740 [marine sediment metagenome]|uniref:Uncharacterized protein n=1 Tax=marine sediment metagenome TaxID=412755 RepID=A0A0F9LEJ2_9ZZZZ
MDSIMSLVNVHVAGTPTFFPGAETNKHRCLLTVMKNRGKNKAGQEMTDEMTLVFWGKYAQTAALFLDKGRCINAEVVPRPYSVDTGQIRPDGKKIIHRITNFSVRSFEFGGDTKKELISRITANIQKAKTEGLLPIDATITAEYLINIVRPQKYDYNPQLVAQTGLYGNAKVFIKGTGFIVPTGVVPGSAMVAEVVDANNIDALQERIESLKDAKADIANAGTDVVADPFVGAAV